MFSITESSVPKTIHYCWFGKKDFPELIRKCRLSWDRNLNDYEIIEWNENNFNLDKNRYVKEAYRTRNYAFVSDYVRAYVLYHFGGIYMDTDVEVLKPFDDLLHHESFWGFEEGGFVATSTIGCKKGNAFIKRFLDSYEDKSFLKTDGKADTLTNVALVTGMLTEEGLLQNGKYQILEEVGAFYPQPFFSPYDYINCRNFTSEKTYTYHHFYKSWLPPKDRFKSNMKMALSKIIGGENIARFREFAARF